jgi:predicted metal-dependent peptidase
LVPTTATDARNFYYNPDYIARLSLEQTQFVLAHEAMHCALSHFARRNHRQKHRWDVACDYAVNMILDEERMQPPDNA